MNQPEFTPTEFFARQDAAKARTGRLVALFALAIFVTAAAIYVAALLCFGAASKHHAATTPWHPVMFLYCLAGTAVVVGGASAFKSSELSGGGDSVAELVGGRIVGTETRDPDERMLVNVIQEMAIASGVRVPDIYILDGESAINAFAAGDTIDNAAIAVTRGALTKLTRDELQAVIGHEFSHILNGDMRLNIRLIGWIFGLMALTVVGRVLFQFAPVTRSSRRDKDDNSGNIGMAIMLFGIVLMFIGFISNLFAQMIQAAISRQREHLADASSTQFTRNPEALANALRRIAGEADGTRLRNPHAAEVAHMCFGEGVSTVFATHPPLEERIRLLKPDWDGSVLPPIARSARDYAPTAAPFKAAPVTEDAEDSGYEAPAEYARLISTPLGAQAAMILLMMSENLADSTTVATRLKSRVTPELFARLKEAWGVPLTVHREDRLTAATLAAPALNALSPAESASLLANLAAVAQTDGEVSGFEKDLYDFVEANAGSRS